MSLDPLLSTENASNLQKNIQIYKYEYEYKYIIKTSLVIILKFLSFFVSKTQVATEAFSRADIL